MKAKRGSGPVGRGGSPVLTSQPLERKEPIMNATLTHQATDKQLSFLTRLLNEATEMLNERQALTGADWPEARAAVQALTLVDDLSKASASRAIDTAMDNNRQLRAELKGLRGQFAFEEARRLGADHAEAADAQVRAEADRPHEFVTTGMYQVDGRIFKVLPSRSSTRHYAQELVGESATGYHFQYARGAMYQLRAEHRMTAEQAAEWGKLTDHCMCCGALLTDPKSIAKGIGPDCAKKYF